MLCLTLHPVWGVNGARKEFQGYLVVSEGRFAHRTPGGAVTSLIVAVGIRLVRRNVHRADDEARGVLGTVLMVAVSEDDDGPVADPAVPRETRAGPLSFLDTPLF